MDFFDKKEDQYKEDPQQSSARYLKQIYQVLKQIADDVERMKRDLDKIHQKFK